jgi:hypothetical protein
VVCQIHKFHLQVAAVALAEQDIQLGLPMEPLEPLEPLVEQVEEVEEFLILQEQIADQLQAVTVLLEHPLLEEALEDQL